jgi:hypothetical protein
MKTIECPDCLMRLPADAKSCSHCGSEMRAPRMHPFAAAGALCALLLVLFLLMALVIS